ncbi:cysteine/serine-rich nuclear protein 2 [Alligator mississippiensis]|nr:cysteine/serine-rich nuclear protein 2 [Alligator mississippiensis]XP_019336619.1 cysteine/serine-rich nuclear protein 2 [Alligator mississippiensis]XP_019336620.1 cysteine/serine-rich nuclear protein 2 [Alligator mississippiensis]XP_019336621.1 cysteine/serine-rich nuclear protein 2 [Alligator mississippiensis]XP_059574207.1 cysteine/serine-rich nuclear protein 2 [Alligator mississippiensis]
MDTLPSASLKRKFEDVDVGSPISNSDDEISNSDSADSCDSVNPPSSTGFIPTSILKRQKQLRRKNVRFDQVTVYYFARRQGFTSVPSQGGSSLGMAQRHNSVRRYTLCEFAQEQEVNHREILREHLKEEKLHAKKMKLTKNGTVESEEADGLTLEDVSDDDIDVENVEVDDYFFLQPLPTKRRRALLRASGVHRIDAEEKQELRAIRLSREECGCDCRLYCDPEACACSQAGIKCQVDRMSFPCGCSRDGCGNMAGRIEFNPIRVRTHYLHTIMKLELENKRQGGRPQALEEESLPSSSGDWLGAQPSETQDFQEFMAENETAVMHLQTAEELERLKAEEDSSSGSSVESLGVCILEEPLAVPEGLCPGLATPILIQAQLPPGSSVLCFADSSEPAPSAAGDPSYLNNGPVVYYQVDQRSVLGAKGEGASEVPEAPSPYTNDKDLGLLSVPVASFVPCSRAAAPGSKAEMGKAAASTPEAPLSPESRQATAAPPSHTDSPSPEPEHVPEGVEEPPGVEERTLGPALAV